ncbi:class IV adenylate cyclase [Candidatus Woesearchaeota archaeon]|nr:class IV adenylate cyclase [Candidatus Woesearchaeota archaeon]
MNEEVEIQVILKNPEEVEEKLKKIAKFVKEREQRDEYFTPQHEDFFSADPPLKYIRVREEDESANIEYQFLHFDKDGRLLKTDEYETKVGNPKVMIEILKKLDFVHKVTVTKNRKTYEYKEFEVMIDYIEELGYFIEVEAKTNGDIKETKKRCYEVLEEIGAKWEEGANMGYPRMIYNKIRGE